MYNQTNCKTVNASEYAAKDTYYSGIPVTLFFNSIFLAIFVFWFALCRFFCSLSDRTLVSFNKYGWFQFIYGERDMEILHPFRRIKRKHRNEYESNWLVNFLNRRASDFDQDQLKKKHKHGRNIQSLGYLYLGYWKISMEDVLEHCGRDAYQYLRFQQKFILFMTISALINFLLLASINYWINYHETVLQDHYQRTLLTYTISHHRLKFIHVFIAIFTSILNVLFNLALFLDRTEPIPENDNVVLIKNIPSTLRNPKAFRKYFRYNFSSEITIKQIFLTYNLESMEEDLQDARCVRLLLEDQAINAPSRREIEQFEECNLKIINSKFNDILTTPGHAMFVRFSKKSEALLFVELHRMQKMYVENYPETELFKQIKPHSGWALQMAPNPWDIHWDSVCMEYHAANYRRYALYILLFFIFFCLTTPVISLTYLKEIFHLFNINSKDFGVLEIYGFRYNFATEFSSWLLILLTCFLPKIVTYSARYIPASFYTERELNILQFTLSFLVIAILIFPSLGLVSLDFIIRQFVFDRADVTLETKCFFNPESGTFFLHYLLSSSAFSFCEISRLCELFEYAYYLVLYYRSNVEYKFAPFRCRLQFSYPHSYAICFLMIYISFAYSIACPLIMTCGTLYMLAKHIVDRINIYYFYESVDLLSIEMEDSIVHLAYFPSLLMLIQVFLSFSGFGHMSSYPVMLVGIWIFVYLYIMFVRKEQIQQWAKHSPNRTLKQIIEFINR